MAALDVRVLLLLVQSFEFCFVLGNYFFAIWSVPNITQCRMTNRL